MNERILCLDFDGVLHSFKSGWLGPDVITDPPVEGAREFLEEVVKHFDVHIFSSRSHQVGGISAMIEWCLKHFGDVTHKINFASNKPPATISLDDRAITFRGAWPSIDSLKRFEPWHKG
jgi:hypothetical protein